VITATVLAAKARFLQGFRIGPITGASYASPTFGTMNLQSLKIGTRLVLFERVNVNDLLLRFPNRQVILVARSLGFLARSHQHKNIVHTKILNAPPAPHHRFFRCDTPKECR
jgi:hypothetical protein